MLKEMLNGEIAFAALVEETLVFLIADRVLHDILPRCICLSDRGTVWRK